MCVKSGIISVFVSVFVGVSRMGSVGVLSGISRCVQSEIIRCVQSGILLF